MILMPGKQTEESLESRESDLCCLELPRLRCFSYDPFTGAVSQPTGAVS